MKQPELGRILADRRKELGLTQEELAFKCKLNIRTVQRIEAGNVKPRMYTLKILSKALDFENGIIIKEQVIKLKELYEHFLLYLIINIFIYGTQIISTSKNLEFHSLTFIWGVFIVFHFLDVFFDVYFKTKREKEKARKWISNLNIFSKISSRILNSPVKNLWIRIIIPLSILIFFIWYLLVGYHDHKVIINKGSGKIIMSSRNAEFEFAPFYKRIAALNEYAINAYEMESTLGKPFSINGHGIIKSVQTINLPDSLKEYGFSVNNVQFILRNSNLYQDNNIWYLIPGKPLGLNIDELMEFKN